jgi:type IX secretion system PorP/SprF family membrane protein
MMKKIGVIILFFLFTLFVTAQQVGMYNHYFYKPMLYNPALTGSDAATNVMLISHAQWAGFKGAPQLNLFTLDGNLANKKIGLGIELISDRKGINKRTGSNLFYSYKINVNDDAHLSFGVSFGVIDQVLDYSKASIESAADPVLFTDAQQKITYDANAGLVFVWKALEVGAAVPQLLGNKINYVDSIKVRSTYSQVRHYMASLKYKFPVSKEKGISVTPGGLVRVIPNAPLQYEGNVNFSWDDKFWIGATYKNNYAITANLGVCIQKQLYVGYSYDIITGDIGNYSGMSHEIMVNFKFGKNKKEEADTVENKPDYAAYEKRLDSLQLALEESQDKIKENQQKLNENQAKIKESQNKIKLNAEQIEELNSKLEQAKIQQQATANTPPSNTPPVQINEPINNATPKISSKPEKKVNKKVPETTNMIEEPALSAPPKSSSTPVKKVEKKISKSINPSPVTVSKNSEASAPSQSSKITDGEVWVVTKKINEFTDDVNNAPQTGYYVITGSFHNRDLAKAEVKRLINNGSKNANWIYSKPTSYNYVFVFRTNNKDEAIQQAKEARASGASVWIQRLAD